MSGRLQGKTAIVTGAARGIGLGIARCLAEEGATLVIGDIEEQAGAQAAEQLSKISPTRFHSADVSRLQDVEQLVSLAEQVFGGVDILVQNAGIYPWTLIENTSVEEWDRVLRVNLRGAFVTAQACLPAMRTRGGGAMIFTSSITGPRVANPGHGHYSASKAGINGFIRAAAVEFSADGIRVNGVEPGNILTDAVQVHRSAEYIASMEAAIPLGRLGTPRDVGRACVFLASDDASYITGTTLVIDGGQILPESAEFRIVPSAPGEHPDT